MTDTEVAVTVPVKKPPRKPRPSEIAAKAAKKAKPAVKAAGAPARKAKRPASKKKKTNGIVKKAVGRPFMYSDQTLVRMVPGTLKRVHAACKTDEGQGDFMRAAIMTELKRRRK